MVDWNIWVTIAGVSLITYGLRACFVVFQERIRLPDVVTRGLRFVPAAVLSALVWPALVYRQGELAISMGNERLLAGVIAAAVAWRTHNILLTIVVGMASLWGISWLMG